MQQMSVQQYRRLRLILTSCLTALLIYSFLSNIMLLAFLGIGLYMTLVSLLKTRVSGVLADERQLGVAAKAAQVSFQVLMPILLLTSVALIMSGGKEEFHYLDALGTVLSYVTGLGLIVYVASYWYLNKKTGG